MLFSDCKTCFIIFLYSNKILRVLVSAPHPASQARGPVPAPGPQRGLGGGGAVTYHSTVNVSNVFHNVIAEMSKKNLTILEIADELEKYDNTEQNMRGEVQITLFPPDGENSEGDSDDEEDPTCNFNKLSRKLLQSEGELQDKDEEEFDMNPIGVYGPGPSSSREGERVNSQQVEESPNSSINSLNDAAPNEYKLEKIIKCKTSTKSGDTEYLCQWEGWPGPEHHTWEKEGGVEGVNLSEFLSEQTKATEDSDDDHEDIFLVPTLPPATRKSRQIERGAGARASGRDPAAGDGGAVMTGGARVGAARRGRGGEAGAAAQGTARRVRGRGRGECAGAAVRDRGGGEVGRGRGRGRVGAGAAVRKGARGRGRARGLVSPTLCRKQDDNSRTRTYIPRRFANNNEPDAHDDNIDPDEPDAHDDNIDPDEPDAHDDNNGHDDEEDENQNKNKSRREQRNKEYSRLWNDNGDSVGSKIPEFSPPPNKFMSDEVQQCGNSPYKYWRLFQNDTAIEEVITQSKLYAAQKNFQHRSKDLDPDSYMCTLGIMLLSGYNKLPVKTMYWTNEPDVFNVMVSENMRRDTFKNCLACIHFSNNLEESQDKFRKVRPLFTNLNSCSLMYMPQSKHLSVDETMIPYYGNNSAKQYIRGKPVR